MFEPSWDYDCPSKHYGGALNCRWAGRGEDLVLEPVPGYWFLGLAISGGLAAVAFLVVVYFVDEMAWRWGLVGIGIAFPILGALVGQALDRNKQTRGRHLILAANGRTLLPRYDVEICPDETTEFRRHEYDCQGEPVEDLVLHHGGRTYYLFSGDKLALQTSETEKLRRELEERLASWMSDR